MTQTPDRKEGEANEQSLLLASTGLSATQGQTRFFSGKYSFFDENGVLNPNQPGGVAPWVWQTSTVDADPGAGNFRTNNATPSSVSAIFISEIDNFGLDWAGAFALNGIGCTVQIASEADLTQTILYRVTGVVDNTNYFRFNVTHEDSSTNFSNFVATEPFRFMLENHGVNSTGTTSVVGEISAYSDTGQKTLGRSDILVGSSSPTVGTRTLGATSAMVGGTITTGGTLVADGLGSVGVGAVTQTSGTATIDSGGSGSLAGGFASSTTGTAQILSPGAGAFAWGQSIVTAAGVSTLQGNEVGAFATGYVTNAGTLEVTTGADGGFVQGFCDAGIIRATTGEGAMARGWATAGGSNIISSGTGSMASGRASASGQLLATNAGSHVFGSATTNDITSSGFGSLAVGWSTNGIITASANNSVQFGPGVNAVADTVQIGDTTDGLRFQPNGVTSTVVGSFWTDGTDVFVRSGAANQNLSSSGGNIDHTGDVTSLGAPATVVALGTSGASVNVNAAAPPAVGNVLKATAATTATWQALAFTDISGTLVAGDFADNTIAFGRIADGTDGELITWSATGVAATVGVGTVNQVLTSGGVGVAPTFQDRVRLHKTITVETPTASENLSMFYTNVAITVTQVTAVILGSTSVSFDIEHGTSRATATGTGVIGTDEVADSTTTGNITTAGFADATIPADSFVWLSTSALSGTPTQLMVTVEYTED